MSLNHASQPSSGVPSNISSLVLVNLIFINSNLYLQTELAEEVAAMSARGSTASANKSNPYLSDSAGEDDVYILSTLSYLI